MTKKVMLFSNYPSNGMIDSYSCNKVYCCDIDDDNYKILFVSYDNKITEWNYINKDNRDKEYNNIYEVFMYLASFDLRENYKK